MPMADIFGLLQFVPLAVTAGAAVFMGAKVGWRRWTATCVGLLGVLLIVRPGGVAFEPYTILAILAVIFSAARDLLSRSVPGHVPPLVIVTTAAALVALTSPAFIAFEDWRQPSLSTFGILVVAAAALLAGQYWLVAAMRTGEIAVVAPFRYSICCGPSWRASWCGARSPTCRRGRASPSSPAPGYTPSCASSGSRSWRGHEATAMRPNRMKEKIARGEPALGCSVMFPSPQIVEMLGYAGFDWVLIDCEHGSIGLGDVELMAMAAMPSASRRSRGRGATPPSDIQSVMDRGVMGVQVPHVNTAEDARRAVAASQVRARRRARAGGRHAAGQLGARRAHARLHARRPTRSRWCASSSSTRRRSATSTRSWRSRASTCSSSAPRIFRSRWAFPAIPRRRRSPRPSTRRWRKIVAAGRAPGMPATAETLPEVVGKGCRYIYTHLPRLIGTGASAFLEVR